MLGMALLVERKHGVHEQAIEWKGVFQSLGERSTKHFPLIMDDCVAFLGISVARWLNDEIKASYLNDLTCLQPGGSAAPWAIAKMPCRSSSARC